eukprot:2798218-Rhodomonas_salina.1
MPLAPVSGTKTTVSQLISLRQATPRIRSIWPHAQFAMDRFAFDVARAQIKDATPRSWYKVGCFGFDLTSRRRSRAAKRALHSRCFSQRFPTASSATVR